MDRIENALGPRTRAGGGYWVLRWLADPLAAYLAMRARFGDRFRLQGTRRLLPFGIGNRHCLGAALATYELALVLATVLGEVDLRAAARPPKMKRSNLGAAPDTGVPMVYEPR